jgi:nucleotide-binding universal stress UspA family protein
VPHEVVVTQVTRILCPVDFSETSVHAVEQAVSLAGWYQAPITALHVYTPFVAPLAGTSERAGHVPESELQRAREETWACLEAANTTGVDVEVLVEVGQPARQIVECAVRSSADLIVMGTHGTSGFEHLLLGSVTEKVLRKAECPVLTVPPRARAASRLPFKRLLCAVDFSDWSLAALEFARSVAEESGASLTLLHVVEWPWREPPAPALNELPPEQAAALGEYRRYIEKSALGRLESLVPGALRDRCTPRLTHGTPYVEVLRLAAAEAVDLIVVGVHGRNPVDVALFGSTTNQIVRGATCPVLTLRH